MRILQIVPYFPPAFFFGGPAKVVYELSRELVRKGNEVVVYTSDAGDAYSRIDSDSPKKLAGLSVYYLKNLTLISVRHFKLFVTPSLIQLLEKEGMVFDVIHLHEYRTFQNVVAASFAKKHDTPYVLQAHGSLPVIMAKQRLKRLYDFCFGYRLLKNASRAIALHPMEARLFSEMGVPDERIEIVPNGIDLSEYSNLPIAGSFKRKYKIGAEEKIILYLGRVNRIKGIDILVKAFARIIGNMKGIRLLIIGPNDGYLGEVENLVRTLKTDDKVLILGPLYGKDKLAAYVDANFCVLPSRYETFPISLLEAYACAKPVIVSRLESLSRLVIDGVTGFLFEPGNIKQLACLMLAMLTDASGTRKMGLEGRRFVKENFTSEIVADKLSHLYEEVALHRSLQ